MTCQQEIFEAVGRALNDDFKIAPDKVKWDRPLKEEEFDSFDMADLFMLLEKDLGMHIHYEEAEDDITPTEIVEFIYGHYVKGGSKG